MTAASKRTAQEVIAMFAALGLPVSDDGAAIQQKISDQRNRYLKDKTKPDPAVRHRADEWFRSVEAMQNRRAELLQVVYDLFCDLAESTLAGASSSGVTTLTPQLKKGLVNIAYRQCRVDDQLADRFLSDFAEKHGLKEGEALVRPGTVENFVANSMLGSISLSWTLPSEKCDAVEIVRVPESTTKSQKESRVYYGRDTSFVDDKNLSPGTWYTYRIYAVYQEIQGADTPARALCLGEVRNAKAAWKEGKMSLSWELPGEGASFLIFRRVGSTPSVQSTVEGPRAAENSTEKVYQGADTSWSDPNVMEGHTYHYRIIADFGQDLFSKGTDVQATVPKAPPASTSLAASHKRDKETEVVALEWQAVPGGMPVEYVVVRREGNAPPGRPEDGTIVQTTTQTRFIDQQVAAGGRYSYAVFSRLGDLHSRTGASATSVDVLAEVTNMKAEAGDGTVELEWSTPPNAKDVVVRRSLSPPQDHSDGMHVKLTGTGHAKDEGLRNGQCYHYLACCVYRPDGISEVYSTGVRISVVPEKLPDPIEDFRLEPQGLEVHCKWTQPEHGQVVVIRSPNQHEMAIGHRLPANEIDALGIRVAGTGTGVAVDSHPDITQPFYSVFTVAGSNAVAGASASCVVCPDVTDLKLSVTKNGIVLRWAWPPNCATVRIIRRADTWPEGADDPKASTFSCMRTDYMNAGDKFIDVVEEGSARFHYVLYAQPAGAPGVFFSPGSHPGCRAVIQWEPWMTMRYQISAPEKNQNQELKLRWNVEKPFPNFSGFVLVAGQSRVPATPDDGVELFRWTPAEGKAGGDHEASIALEPIHRRRWARFYCKAVVIDPAQRHSTLLIHPNISVPISENGEWEVPSDTVAAEGFRPGVPRNVICPQCFEEFPVDRMLFTSPAGGEPVPAKYSLIDKMRGLPPQPPVTKQGQKLTRKLCPNRHLLPFTAGAQSSLVIGLIGAKYSGKSHYIAALVKRLEEQVGSDMQASLLSVSDETQDRYRREFHDPLFKDCLELPVTIGTPPPLIYDLTLDGRIWGEKRNRAVTLALYDTAGENLDKQETVEQMLKYLKVASGIIFLIDPLQVPAVREVLPSTIDPPRMDHEAEPNTIISRILQVLEDGKALAEARPLSTPVAVALTKCDVLREAGLIEPNRLWTTETRHIGYFDRETHEDMTGMMGEHVQRWSEAAYNTVRRRFPRHSFFGVSATGCAPDKNTRRYKYIAPWRVEDPLLWLLAELGVIPIR